MLLVIVHFIFGLCCINIDLGLLIKYSSAVIHLDSTPSLHPCHSVLAGTPFQGEVWACYEKKGYGVYLHVTKYICTHTHKITCVHYCSPAVHDLKWGQLGCLLLTHTLGKQNGW